MSSFSAKQTAIATRKCLIKTKGTNANKNDQSLKKFRNETSKMLFVINFGCFCFVEKL